MTKQEAIAAIEKKIGETGADIVRLRGEVAGNMCTAMGKRRALAEIAHREAIIMGMGSALAIVSQISDGAEYVPVVEAVR